MKFVRMNQKGQAALVDSLFFIAIISTICAGLFYFAINYGTSMENLLNSFYSSDFAMDSLKVITYINVMRDGTSIGTPSANPSEQPKFDYLLALIKEDYSRNKDLTINTKTAIANTLHSVLAPFDSSMDYVFVIAKEGYKVGEEKYLAMIIATRKCVSGCETNSDARSRIVDRVYYSCAPTQSNALEKYIFPNVGNIDSAMGKITLVENDSTYTYYVMGIYMWVGKRITAIDRIVNTSEELDPVKRESEFNCTLLPTQKLAGEQ